MAHSDLIHLLLMLLIAIAWIALFKRWGLPAILAYLVTGAIAGPSGFDWFSATQMHSVAELGVVLLMFSLGLEFSLSKLWQMRRSVFGFGFAQVAITALLSGGIAWCFGFSSSTAIVIGAAIALSSTAIVLKLLQQLGWLRQRQGELSVSILLFQDIAVVPLLILLPMLAAGNDAGDGGFYQLAFALSKGVFASILLMALGKWALVKIFDEIARIRLNEVFVLSALVVALATGALTHYLGLSMALGAFMAGMLLSESQYKHQLEVDIRPFRDLLMGLFFISIGMLLDFTQVQQHWLTILSLLLVVLLVKTLIITGILKFAGESLLHALATGITLAQVGEFSFVVLALAVSYQLVPSEVSTVLVMVAVASMTFAPWLVRHSQSLARHVIERFSQQQLPDNARLLQQQGAADVLILGYGKVGQTISRFLSTEAISFVALDNDPTRVNEARAAGDPVYFGDCRQRSLLKQLGIRQVKLVVLTYSQTILLEETVHLCRKLAPKVKILVRTRDDELLEVLEAAGASQVIPESLEGSLMLVSQVLHQCGIPQLRIDKRLASERRAHYPYLHGFFSGSDSRQEQSIEQLHAVAITGKAFATHQPLKQIPWAELAVRVTAVRRNHQEFAEPNTNWLLTEGDIVLIQGAPRDIELAERYLLEGH